jgi:hypothetical protein
MCKNILSNVIGFDPGSEHVGFGQQSPDGHLFGEIKLSMEGAWQDIEAKIDWADLVVVEEYRPREFLQGDGPKTAETIGRIKEIAGRLGKRVETVNHITWRTWAGNLVATMAMVGAERDSAIALHFDETWTLTNGHWHDGGLIALWGAVNAQEVNK